MEKQNSHAARRHAIAQDKFGVYVAASAAPGDAERVRGVIATLKAQGFHITCSWPDVVAATPGGSNPRDATHLQRRQWAVQDLAEIDASDAVLFLVPTPPATTRGAWWEASHGHDADKHVVFAGDTKQSIFCALGIEFETDAAAITYLHRLRVERGLRELESNAPHADEWPGVYELGGEGG